MKADRQQGEPDMKADRQQGEPDMKADRQQGEPDMKASRGWDTPDMRVGDFRGRQNWQGEMTEKTMKNCGEQGMPGLAAAWNRG